MRLDLAVLFLDDIAPQCIAPRPARMPRSPAAAALGIGTTEEFIASVQQVTRVGGANPTLLPSGASRPRRHAGSRRPGASVRLWTTCTSRQGSEAARGPRPLYGPGSRPALATLCTTGCGPRRRCPRTRRHGSHCLLRPPPQGGFLDALDPAVAGRTHRLGLTPGQSTGWLMAAKRSAAPKARYSAGVTIRRRRAQLPA